MIFLRALKPDVFDGLQFRRMPSPPNGWEQDHAEYLMTNISKKSEAWKILEGNYRGFLKSRDDAKTENDSNKKFLEDAYSHLKAVGCLAQAETYRNRLNEFEITSQMPY